MRSLMEITARPLGRSVDFIVASNDATELIKAQADYICDGTSDDVEIQTAINRCSATYGGAVVLSEGAFNLTTGITLPTKVTLSGMGKHATKVVQGAGSDINLFTINADTHSVGIREMWLRGDAGASTAGSAIVLSDNVWRPALEGLRVDNFPVSALTTTGAMTAGLFGISLRRCWFWSPVTATGHIVYIKRGHSSVIMTDCGFGTDAPPTIGYSALYFEDCYEVFGVNCSVWGCKTGITLEGTYPSYNKFSNFFFDSLQDYAIYLSNADYNQFTNCFIYATGQNSGAGICIGLASSKYNQFNNISIADGEGLRNGSPTGYVDTPIVQSIVETGTSDYNTYNGIRQKTTVAALPTLVGTHNIYTGNGGFIYPGEIRHSSGSLTAGNANAFAFAWQNPEPQAILATVVVDITTAGGTAGSVLDAGSAANATTTSDNLIDGADLNATDTLVTLAKVKLAANGGATDWITGQILTQNAASLVGKYYIEYTGV